MVVSVEKATCPYSQANLRGMIEDQGKEMNELRKSLESKEKELIEFIEATKDDLNKKDEDIADLESQAEDNMEVFQVILMNAVIYKNLLI